MPTLAEVQTLLSRYAGNGNTFLERLNLVRARLMDDGAWPGMTPKITLAVYTDADGASIVTLPREYLAILRGYAVSTAVLCGQSYLGTNGVFSMAYNSAFNDNFQEVPDYFCVFREWTTPMQIRFKFEVAELAGTLYLSGTNAGADVWATNSGTWERREALAFVGTTTVTSVNSFDAKGFGLVKPVTKGRVSAYTWDGTTETLVAVYQPTETQPRWRRYKVPCTAATDQTYVAIAKMKYVPLVNSYEEVVPGNISALRFGLDALLKEDAQDFDASEDLWELARARLIRQSEAESDGTSDRIEIEDDMGFATIGNAL